VGVLDLLWEVQNVRELDWTPRSEDIALHWKYGENLEEKLIHPNYQPTHCTVTDRFQSETAMDLRGEVHCAAIARLHLVLFWKNLIAG